MPAKWGFCNGVSEMGSETISENFTFRNSCRSHGGAIFGAQTVGLPLAAAAVCVHAAQCKRLAQQQYSARALFINSLATAGICSLTRHYA
jgi:predicted outer membrane repeat protein